MPKSVLPVYGIEEQLMNITPFGSGLINNTWKIELPGREYILQKINQSVFKNPAHIAENIKMVADYLEVHHPGYKFIAPITTSEGKQMYTQSSDFYRLFPFERGSHTIDVVENLNQAFEAAQQFGRFTKLLARFDARRLHITLPCFHDLGMRYEHFLQALKQGNPKRIKESADLAATIISHSNIVSEYKAIKSNPEFKIRVTHHDTKISNVLFDEDDRGLCVIDLDTMMPGYFISDLGDMMRTYLSPVSEEERDFSKIEIRTDIYNGIVRGYYGEMKDALTQTEKNHFFYAGKFMIYMQAVRFLTDYLNNDIYYGAAYPEHNFVRAGNQLTLLHRLLESETILDAFNL